LEETADKKLKTKLFYKKKKGRLKTSLFSCPKKNYYKYDLIQI